VTANQHGDGLRGTCRRTPPTVCDGQCDRHLARPLGDSECGGSPTGGSAALL